MENVLIELLFARVLCELILKLVAVIEMILNNTLASVCDYEDILNTCRCGFLNDVLYRRLVNNVEHLLRNSL